LFPISHLLIFSIVKFFLLIEYLKILVLFFKERTKIEDPKNYENENKFQDLLFNKPQLIPLDLLFGEETNCIPLVREFKIKKGIIDIVATDDEGGIYIIECKLNRNPTTKNLIPQLSKYLGYIWTECNVKKGFAKEKFEKFWKYFNDQTSKYNQNKTLEKILEEKIQDKRKVNEIIEQMKYNFKHHILRGILAVDDIPDYLRDSVNYHNCVLDGPPIYILEIQKFSHNGNEFYSIRHHPNDRENSPKNDNKSENRHNNSEEEWRNKFKKYFLPEEVKINNFVKKLKKMVEDDGGFMEWGSGIGPGALPKFKDFSERSPIKIGDDGTIHFQFHLMKGVYRNDERFIDFQNGIEKIHDLVEEGWEDRYASPPKIPAKKWIPHAENILDCLKVFTRKESSEN